jgi:hypothetical protein
VQAKKKYARYQHQTLKRDFFILFKTHIKNKLTVLIAIDSALRLQLRYEATLWWI